LKERVIKSPCIQVCFVDPDLRHCVGCWRSLEEIGRWAQYSDEEREAIMDELKQRAPDLREAYFNKRGLTPPPESS